MEKLLEVTEKYIITSEQEVTDKIEEYKNKEEGLLVDHKVSLKETKTGEYYIVTLKLRHLTLPEAKELI